MSPDPWTTFDRRIVREGITIPPMLGPYLDQLRESGGEPPQVGYVAASISGPFVGSTVFGRHIDATRWWDFAPRNATVHAVLVIDCGDLGLTPTEVVDG